MQLGEIYGHNNEHNMNPMVSEVSDDKVSAMENSGPVRDSRFASQINTCGDTTARLFMTF